MARDPRSYLPLRPVDVQLLLTLAEAEQHGYGLAQSLAERTDGLMVLDPGNLYRVIKRLLADGLVAEQPARHAPDLENERRRYYRLTPLGGRVLAAELSRLRLLVSTPTATALVRRWAT